MSTRVSIPVSDRYNSLYDEKDLHHALMALSISNGYAESGMRRLSIEADARVPSGSWVRDRVGGVKEESVVAMLDHALDSTLEQVKSFRVFTSPITAAIDTHDLPRYDRDLDRGFLRRGKQDRGDDQARGLRHPPVRRGGEEGPDCLRTVRFLRREG